MKKHREQKEHDSTLIVTIMHALVKRRRLGLERSGKKGIGSNMLNLLLKQAPVLEILGW